MAKTMSHTEEQRKLWHRGKRLDQRWGGRETKMECFVRCRKEQNFQGAYTPPWMKRGITYRRTTK